MELLLIRHPKPAGAPGGRYGGTDLALAVDPAAVAARLAPHLPGDGPIISSPLSRCRLLAQALAGGRPVRLEPRLREIHFGAWEMQPWARIERAAIDAWAADPFGFRPPGGETAEEMSVRALACLAEWLRPPRPPALIVVAHGGPLRAIAGHVRGLPQRQWLQQSIEVGELVRLNPDLPRGE